MTRTEERTTGLRFSGPEQGRALATVVALTFLLVGVLGFIPGITSHYDDMEFAGHHSDAELLGIFDISVLHNLVHLAFGLVGLALARTARGGAGFLIGGGFAYLTLVVYGLVVDHSSDANFVPLDQADNWLHLGLGFVMLVLGLRAWAALRGKTPAN